MRQILNKDYLFVYGTLRKDFSLPLTKKIKNDIELVGRSEVLGRLYDLGEYPAAMPSQNSRSKIEGDLYVIKHPKRILDLLDKYEGDEYKRKRIGIKMNNGEIINAWIYWYNISKRPRIRIKQKSYLTYLKEKNEINP